MWQIVHQLKLVIWLRFKKKKKEKRKYQTENICTTRYGTANLSVNSPLNEVRRKQCKCKCLHRNYILFYKILNIFEFKYKFFLLLLSNQLVKQSHSRVKTVTLAHDTNHLSKPSERTFTIISKFTNFHEPKSHISAMAA